MSAAEGSREMTLLHASRAALAGVVVLALGSAGCSGCRSSDVSPEQERATPSGARPSSPGQFPAAQSPAAQSPAAQSPAAQYPAASAPAATGAPAVAEQNTVQLDTTSGKPPEDWPSDVPLYPGGKVQLSMKLGHGSTVTLETPDALPKVSEWYEAQLASMPQRNAVDSGKRRTLMWSDPSRPLQVTLTLDAADGVTRATLIVVASK